MEVGKAIYSILSNDSDVSALVGTRIFPNVAKNTTQFPFIIYEVKDENPEDTKDGVSTLDVDGVMIGVYTSSYTQGAELSKKTRTALDRVSGTYEEVVVQSIQYKGYNDEFTDNSGSEGVFVNTLDFNIRIVNVSIVPPSTLLLDVYTGAAVAYSLRKLKSTTTNVVRVRRSSDNVELDFTASEITDGTLTTWTGANDGFVAIWYDQSGNNENISQASATNQPKLVIGGSIILDNGKPAVEFDGVNDYLSKASLTDFESGLFVYNFDAIANNIIVGKIGISQVNYIFNSLTQISFDGDISTNDEARMSLNGANLTSYAENQTGSYSINNQYQLYFNYDISRGMNSSLDAIGYLRATFMFSGKIQEIITWSNDNSSNVHGINTNVNDFYSIY